ncbi:peptide chain release factor 2 [Buchnera aphidicola (Taiwanaphis decaspermi)]|uniref:peptide chain release factor 2 n=1 Tax=Buchnera aphidicola TaxID=9 RepID=UPI0031B892E8
MIDNNVINIKIIKLFNKYNIIKKKFLYHKKKKKLKKINIKLSKKNIWENNYYAKILSKKRSSLICIIRKIKNIKKNINDIKEIFKLYINNFDKKIFKEIMYEIYIVEQKINKLNISKMFTKKNDILNCYIDIQSGSGGLESQNWSKMLQKMYLKWAEKKKFKTKITEESYSYPNGIKSSTIHIVGKYAFGWTRTETGIHRLVRKSPFDSNNKRHTSFSSIFVYPDIEKKIKVELDTSQLRIDVYRASGAGGQHVNRTESAVRITHLPTKIVTQCQNNRSQHQNKEQAIKQMKSKLYKLELLKKNKDKKILESIKSSIGWGNQIRSYVLDNSRIKDLRTGMETCNIQNFLDGNLDLFIEASLKLGL